MYSIVRVMSRSRPMNFIRLMSFVYIHMKLLCLFILLSYCILIIFWEILLVYWDIYLLISPIGRLQKIHLYGNLCLNRNDTRLWGINLLKFFIKTGSLYSLTLRLFPSHQNLFQCLFIALIWSKTELHICSTVTN